MKADEVNCKDAAAEKRRRDAETGSKADTGRGGRWDAVRKCRLSPRFSLLTMLSVHTAQVLSSGIGKIPAFLCSLVSASSRPRVCLSSHPPLVRVPASAFLGVCLAPAAKKPKDLPPLRRYFGYGSLRSPIRSMDVAVARFQSKPSKNKVGRIQISSIEGRLSRIVRRRQFQEA